MREIKVEICLGKMCLWFGHYLTIQVALEGYKGPMKIQTLYIQQQLSIGEDPDLENSNAESGK